MKTTKFGYRPKCLKLHEVVGPELYKKYGLTNPEYLWRLIDESILEAMDIIKEFYNGAKITVNNYYWKGNRKESGLRDMNTSTGASLSAHKFGRAIDFQIEKVSSEQVQSDIRNNKLPARFYDLINTVEKGTVGWTHIARLNYVTNSIVWVNP